MTKFVYHRHIQEIADADVQYVLKKDKHYEASWKEDAGPGAYFTMKRPIDRFIAIAKRNNYDIFKVILAEGLVGPDGSLIACVRDARRYLLLLEAELTEQLAGQWQDAEDEQTRPPVHPVVLGPGTPEDGGHHARQPVPEEESFKINPALKEGHIWPWVVGWGRLNDVELELRDAWRRMAPGTFVLEPRLVPEEFLAHGQEVRALYDPVWKVDPRELDVPPTYTDKVANGEAGEPPVAYWLRVDRAPKHERARWRTLPEEQNLKESEELMEYLELYSWNVSKQRYILRRPEWRPEP